MCSLAVLDMPEDVSPPGQTPRQPLHPFFAPNRVNSPLVNKKAGNKDTESATGTHQALSDPSDGTVKEDDLEQSSGRQAKRRKVNSDENVGEEGKKKRGRPKKVPEANSVNSSPWALGPGSRTSGEEVVSVSGMLQCMESHVLNPDDAVADDSRAGNITTGAQPETPSKADQTAPNLATPTVNSDNPPKPKKMLIFNPKTGTIGSPPKPKQSKAAESKRKDDRKGSPRNGQPVSRIVKVTYGSDPESRLRIGERIDAILNNKPKAPSSTPIVSDNSSCKVNPPLEVAKAMAPKPPKTTHPFFLGKLRKSEVPVEEAEPKKADKPTAPKKPKVFTATPCSPKKPRAEAPLIRMPQFGSKIPGLKFPGAKLPAWPWKDMVHVRGEEGRSINPVDNSLPLSSRKAKGNSVKVLGLESVVGVLTRELQVPTVVETVRNINTDEFLPPPVELRLPQKHFESGTKLQLRIISELRTFQSSLLHTKKGRRSKIAADESDVGPQPPPQLAQLFNTIRSGLSAFDRSTCETASWTQKYAPSSAVEVLQPGKEAFLLRDWLQALTVQSVDTGSTDKENPKASRGKSADLGKKKRRKKLDGFIVSSGDEEYELEELSDAEPDWTVDGAGGEGSGRRTIVRSGNLSKMKDGVRIANALIISGPHGCGKTAAVYAVAKELDFEVFELNPGSRRSGKDVLEKIGDMTRNHLVRQHRPGNQAEDGEAAVTDDEVAKDLKSGKQATMSAFFKPKPITAKPKDTTESAKQVETKESKRMSKKESSKNQRQSLILLEEVDILYAEDKQFWATVMELIGQSKRPFIMTCNDETLLPVQSLRLHGIFRFSPPPRELSIDRLLLIAANEGHALSRHAVETLYESRSQDLRAATTDLQYWCQIGVGDCRGGFEWFYPRFPKGVDLDENKEVIRVVSEGTYHAGMSWLGRDSIVDPEASPRTIGEELLRQTWHGWGLDMGHWQDSTGLSSWATELSPAVAAREGRLSLLESFESLSEALSVADVCSCRSFAMFPKEILDTTLPELSEKAQEDLVLGFSLLDTASATEYDSLLTSLPSTIKSLAKSCLKEKTETFTNQPEEQLSPLDESKVVSYIKSSFQSPAPGISQITRLDFAFAFDPISESDSSSTQPATYLDPSVFDRNFEPIILDVAPYVRSIVAYDSRLQKQRLKLSSLVSQGGKVGQGAKRMRTTRAALSALEGGSRSTTRGEKWFKADINPYYVMRTAGQGWDGSRDEEEEEQTTPAPSSRTSNSPDSSPAQPVKKAMGRRGRPRKVVADEESADELGGAAEM